MRTVRKPFVLPRKVEPVKRPLGRQRGNQSIASIASGAARMKSEMGYHGIDREYKGIEFCDRCGEPLDERQWLAGLCRRCEKAVTDRRDRPIETLTPRKGLL